MKMRMKKMKTQEEDDDDTDDEEGEYDDEDDDDESDEDDKKIRPWDVLMNITSENMQERFNEAVEKTLEENPGTDIQKAEKTAYHDLKPKYLSDFYIPLQEFD